MRQDIFSFLFQEANGNVDHEKHDHAHGADIMGKR